MLREVMMTMGGDPTAVTPSADIHGVASKGLCAVLADPRTTLRESLEAILVAELVDNDCWENLSDLARAIGEEKLARTFEGALEEERDHLRRVRSWIGAALSQAATGELAAAFQMRTEDRENRTAPRRPDRPRETKRAVRRGASKSKPSRASGRSKKARKAGAHPRSR
jgi:hypothetical protein